MSDERWPKVAIIILNWNGWRDTIECLESLQQITYPNYQIVVIDNGSVDDSIEHIKAWAKGQITVHSDFLHDDKAQKPIPIVEIQYNSRAFSDKHQALESAFPRSPIILVSTGQNLGFAGGVNVGLRFALERDFEYIWLLNNDTVVHPEALTELVKALNHDPEAGMAGSKILFYDQPNIIQEAGVKAILGLGLFFMRDRGLPDTEGRLDKEYVEFFSGCSLLVRAELVKLVGFMDETYFLYGEESDWQIRAKRHGWKLVYVPKSRVWHKLGKSSGGSGSRVHAYFTTRNPLLLVARYSRWTLPVAVVIHCLRIVRKIARKKWVEAFHMTRGLLDGVYIAFSGSQNRGRKLV